MEKSVFATLNAINCNEHTEAKNGLTYLSWAWAWQMVKINYPSATYKVYETPDGINYFTDGRTCWVKTGVTIEGIEHIEYLPVMDFKNRSIPLDNVTSFDVNKTIQRSLTKACARHGLGLYIYAGEDLPDTDNSIWQEEQPKKTRAKKPTMKEDPFASAPQNKPAYKPLEKELYLKFVQAFAEGKLCKSGKDCRTAWIEATNAGDAEIQMFDYDVAGYKAGGLETAPFPTTEDEKRAED